VQSACEILVRIPTTPAALVAAHTPKLRPFVTRWKLNPR
jgi:hypothetical protein